jgi:hypothetical protein
MGDKSGVTKERIAENYYQIKSDITQMIESEIQLLLKKSSKIIESHAVKVKRKKTKSTGKRS